MAVAAHVGVVYVYALKSMDLMREELRDRSSLSPIKEVRTLIQCIAIDQADINDLKGTTHPSRRFHMENGISPSTTQ